MRVLDLFSGIGGFALGLERAGMEIGAMCEIDPYCRRVLAKHWPGVPVFEDIRDLDGDAVGDGFDLVCGGFPCQPWSLAGRRGGSDDDRHLWPEMLRVVGAVRPRWVVGENVPGLDDERFMALDGVLADLEGIGYQAVPLEIPACAVDAPHKRSRVWIVAYASGARSSPSEREAIQRTGRRREGRTAAERRQTSGGHWDGAEWLLGNDGKARRVEPGIRLLAHGVPQRVARLKALGNAVVPPVVERIGREIMESEAP